MAAGVGGDAGTNVIKRVEEVDNYANVPAIILLLALVDALVLDKTLSPNPATSCLAQVCVAELSRSLLDDNSYIVRRLFYFKSFKDTIYVQISVIFKI